MVSVQEVARQAAMGLASDHDKAIALHNYVRDRVKFGFTRYFDTAKPDYTLACGIGHCNPKSWLMDSLSRGRTRAARHQFIYRRHTYAVHSVARSIR
jgi:transglutaminase-like putative cysteine protease